MVAVLGQDLGPGLGQGLSQAQGLGQVQNLAQKVAPHLKAAAMEVKKARRKRIRRRTRRRSMCHQRCLSFSNYNLLSNLSCSTSMELRRILVRWSGNSIRRRLEQGNRPLSRTVRRDLHPRETTTRQNPPMEPQIRSTLIKRRIGLGVFCAKVTVDSNKFRDSPLLKQVSMPQHRTTQTAVALRPTQFTSRNSQSLRCALRNNLNRVSRKFNLGHSHRLCKNSRQISELQARTPNI